MQYDLDTSSPCADIFYRIRTLLLSYPEVHEIRNAKQTSYHSADGVIAMMRVRDEKLVVSFGQGAKLQARFPQLRGEGKMVRHLYFRMIDEVDEVLLREMIEESLVLAMEAAEMRRLKTGYNNRKKGTL